MWDRHGLIGHSDSLHYIIYTYRNLKLLSLIWMLNDFLLRVINPGIECRKNQKDGIQSELAYMEIPNRKQCFIPSVCTLDWFVVCHWVKGPKHVSFVTTTIEVWIKLKWLIFCPFYNIITSLTHYLTKV